MGRGSGILRLIDGKAWTLLTTLDELQGFEEPKGPGRPRASSTAPIATGSPGSSGGSVRLRSWAMTTSRMW